MSTVILPQAFRADRATADEHLRQPAEGRGARQPDRPGGDPAPGRASTRRPTPTSLPYVAASVIFLVGHDPLHPPRRLRSSPDSDGAPERRRSHDERTHVGAGERTVLKLQLRGVFKAFDDTTVLDGIDLDVAQGRRDRARSERRGPARPRCCAASTCSSRSTTARSSSTASTSAEPGLDPDPIRRRIGMVFQSFNLFPHMTVARQRHDRPAQGARDLDGDRVAPSPGAARRGSDSPTRPTPIPTTCRAASSNVSRSPGRWR